VPAKATQLGAARAAAVVEERTAGYFACYLEEVETEVGIDSEGTCLTGPRQQVGCLKKAATGFADVAFAVTAALCVTCVGEFARIEAGERTGFVLDSVGMSCLV
jgi:hypothetical protein